MNNFDGDRKLEMDEILNFMYKITNTRPITRNDVYAVLKFYNLKNDDRVKDKFGREVFDGIDNEGFFKYWENRFASKKHIHVYVDPRWTYFFQFTNNISHSTERFIKLYVALDSKHLYDGANLLFDFLERNNISHLSKISKKLRVDNVIIRLNYDDFESAKKIIDFINKTPFLKAGLNKPNPFIPTINGIGYMQEHGNSYNSDISDFIKEYLNVARRRGQESVSAEEFRTFLQECQKNNITYVPDQIDFDDSLMNTFEIAYTGKNKNLNANNISRLNNEQKRSLLINALRATFSKYGINQVRTALIQIIKFNNYGFVTNGGPNNRYRENLKKYLTPEDIMDIINIVNKAKNDMKFLTVEDKINAFCMELFRNELPFILDDICGVTLENYGASQVSMALNEYMRTGSGRYFSRFKNGDQSINYRDKLRMFDRTSFMKVVFDSLTNKGIEAKNIPYQELLHVYADAIAKEKIIVQER